MEYWILSTIRLLRRQVTQKPSTTSCRIHRVPKVLIIQSTHLLRFWSANNVKGRRARTRFITTIERLWFHYVQLSATWHFRLVRDELLFSFSAISFQFCSSTFPFNGNRVCRVSPPVANCEKLKGKKKEGRRKRTRLLMETSTSRDEETELSPEQPPTIPEDNAHAKKWRRETFRNELNLPNIRIQFTLCRLVCLGGGNIDWVRIGAKWEDGRE